MKDDLIRMIQQMVVQESARLPGSAASAVTKAPAGIQFSELPRDDSNGPLAREWNVYCREVGRLLAEGQQGRFVVIKGEEIVGIFDDWAAARVEGLKRFVREPFFVHEIREVEPHLYIRGINRPWLELDGPGRRFSLEF
jgi:hypothetical protein